MRISTAARPLTVAACILFAVAGSARAGSGDLRTWTDSTGTHSVEASFARCLSGTVKLRKVTGVEISVPLDQLSAPDRNFIRQHVRAARLSTRRELLRAPTDANIAPIDKPANDALPLAKPPAGTTELYGIHWYASPEQAAGSGQHAKTWMWFRVLGDLDGFM